MNYPQQGYGPPPDQGYGNPGYGPAQPGYPAQGYGPPPGQGYGPPPQPGYGPPPGQGYGPPQGQAPQPQFQRPTLNDYLRQPAQSGGSINKPVFPQPGARVLVRVARPLSDADVDFQTDMNTGAIRTFNDNHPRLLLRVPVLVSHAAVPDGHGVLIMRGQMYEEVKRAMGEAGNTTGIPEAGAVIDITRQNDRPVQNRSAQHIFTARYDRSQVAPQHRAENQADGRQPEAQAPQAQAAPPQQAPGMTVLAQAAAPDMAQLAAQQQQALAAAGAPVQPPAQQYQQAPPPAPPPQPPQAPPAQQYQQGPPQPPQPPAQQYAPPAPPPAPAPQYQQAPPQAPTAAQAPQYQGQAPGQYQQGPPLPAAPASLDPSQETLLQGILSQQQ